MSRIHVKPARGSDSDIEPDYDRGSDKYSSGSSIRPSGRRRVSPAVSNRPFYMGYSRSDNSYSQKDDNSNLSIPVADYGEESLDSLSTDQRSSEPRGVNRNTREADPEDPPADYDNLDNDKSNLVPSVVVATVNGTENLSFLDDEADSRITHGSRSSSLSKGKDTKVQQAETENSTEAVYTTAITIEDGSSLRSRGSSKNRETVQVAVAVGASATAAALLSEAGEEGVVEPRGLNRRHSHWQNRDESKERSIQPDKRDSGYSKWKKERAKEWRRFKALTSETLENLQIWQGSFKAIEGRFGSPVLAYFRFLKWLFFLNLLLALLVLGVIVLPQAFMSPSTFEELIELIGSNETDALYCSKVYEESLDNKSGNVFSDFVQGTGWMERTPLFYGYYFNRTYDNIITGQLVYYNMSVGYLLTVFAYFLISLFLMVGFTAKGMRSRITSSQGHLYLSCNKVFCGWDFSLSDPDAASFKHIQLQREYMRDLAVKRRKEELKNQSTFKRALMMTVRIIINIIVLCILGASGYLIYYLSTQSLEWLQLSNVKENAFLKLLVEFSPSLTITVLNFIVPLIMQKLVLAEGYSPSFEIKITIFRSVTLRLASVAVLLVGIGGRILGCEEKICGTCKKVSWCWETYVGQQFYKLVLLDFVTVVLMTFLIQFPRKLIVRSLEKSQSKLFKLASYQEFEIPKEVLDIVYTQTLCWIGAFVSPIVLCMTVIKLFLFFYIKKLSLLYNCRPATRLYRASSSQTFFMSILILAFVLCAIPVAFAIGKIPPSRGCGPFRVYNDNEEEFFMFNALTDLIATWPGWFQNIMAFITSWTFYVPLIVIVCLVTYYYVSLAAGKQEYIKVLLQQLSVATKDKQFLVHEALARRKAAKGD